MTQLDSLIKFILTDPLPKPIVYQGEKFISLKPIIAEDGTIKETFCNVAVWYITTKLGFALFGKGVDADDMVGILEENCNELLAQDAQEAAKKGLLVVAGKQYPKHGHVAVVAPSPTGDLYHSGSWNRFVPYVANVGHKNGIMPVSQAFPVADDEPGYHLIK